MLTYVDLGPSIYMVSKACIVVVAFFLQLDTGRKEPLFPGTLTHKLLPSPNSMNFPFVVALAG